MSYSKNRSHDRNFWPPARLWRPILIIFWKAFENYQNFQIQTRNLLKYLGARGVGNFCWINDFWGMTSYDLCYEIISFYDSQNRIYDPKSTFYWKICDFWSKYWIMKISNFSMMMYLNIKNVVKMFWMRFLLQEASFDVIPQKSSIWQKFLTIRTCQNQ